MGKKTVLLMVIAVLGAVPLDVCWCSLDLTAEPSSSQDHNPSWLQQNYNQAFNSEHVQPIDAARNVMESAGNTASKIKDTVNSAASEASKYTSEQTCMVAGNACGTTASYIKDAASEKTESVIKMVGSNEAEEKLKNAMEYGKEKASSAYDSAKDRFANALRGSGQLSNLVDSYDFHADWPSEEDGDDERKRGSGTSYSKLGRHIAKMANNAADGTDSDSEGDFTEGIDYGRSRLSNYYNQDHQHRIWDSAKNGKDKEAEV